MKITFVILIVITFLCIGLYTGILLQKNKIPNFIKRKLVYTFKNFMGFKEFDYSIPMNPRVIDIFGEPSKIFDAKTDLYIGSTKPEQSSMSRKEFSSYRYFSHIKEIANYLVSDEAKQIASKKREEFWEIKDGTIEDYLKEMESKRRFLKKTLGVQDLEPNGKVKERCVVVDNESMVIEKVTLGSRIPAISVPLFIARPKGIKIKGVVIAIHGVASVPENVVGIEPRDYTRQFGLQLVKHGYVVYAPYIVNISNRTSNISGLGMLYTGNTNWSIDMQKLLAVVDHIKTKSELSELPLVTYGISIGGHFSSMLAAIDKRINIAISSGSLLGGPIASDFDIEREINTVNYFLLGNPDLEILFKHSDYAKLIFPRPLILELGAFDTNIYETEKIPTGSVDRWFEIQDVYKRYHKEKCVKLILFNGFHETVPELILPVLDEFVNELNEQGC